jgi:hypothetical protein
MTDREDPKGKRFRLKKDHRSYLAGAEGVILNQMHGGGMAGGYARQGARDKARKAGLPPPKESYSLYTVRFDGDDLTVYHRILIRHAEIIPDIVDRLAELAE